ncbi:hypothetical protein [Flavobacterium suzhouense]|uniref:Lipocalin-like domain-containing protein n=1 Tax=Flavobacterium suzhouense TaxID=1529638 RepID=A0ABW5P0A6_9FLAO
MRKIALLLLALMAVSCTQNKQEIKTIDMQGHWKTLQTKVSKKTPIHDVNCEDGKAKWNGSVYTFNTDGSFSAKDICTGKSDSDSQKCKWKYEDHVLILESIYKGKDMRQVYSVSDIGDGKTKWKIIYTRYDQVYNMEDSGYYLIMQKQ